MPTFLPPDVQPEPAPSKTQESLTRPHEGREEYEEVLRSLKLSEKIHVMGFTGDAKYITHCLAGTPDLPPPQILVHHHDEVNQWGASNRKLSVRNKEGLQKKHEILMPQYVGKALKAGPSRAERPRLKHIDNLVLCTNENAILPTLLSIRDSINQDTTICLVTEGLGIVRHLNNVIFQDPSTRPTFILGHSGYALSRDPMQHDDGYAIEIRNRGRLFLSKVSAQAPSDDMEINTWDRVVRQARAQHLVKLLASSPGLNVTALPASKFLRYKLPSMIFSALADATSVGLGFHYNRLATDRYARRLWGNLWAETIAIVSALPEVQRDAAVLAYFQGHNFKTEVERFLLAQRDTSPWVSMVRHGRTLPMQSLNGWFVGMAEELGLSSVHHKTMINLVKAKIKARNEELKSDIPLYHSPYMLDNDYARNHDEKERPHVHIVYTNK
ncbi:hypothetical protein TruAng_010891 [Truncatella angustata]|nr:hypothetical protein TruAng_010891 [Truncatella angustata]